MCTPITEALPDRPCGPMPTSFSPFSRSASIFAACGSGWCVPIGRRKVDGPSCPTVLLDRLGSSSEAT